MNVVCVYYQKSLHAVIEKPDDKTDEEVVRQWLRINGYKDWLLKLFEFSSSPVTSWTESMATQPQIED